MFSLWCITAVVQCCILLCVYYGAMRLLHDNNDKNGALGEYALPPHARIPRDSMPPVALIIPAAGNHPHMETALRSLLTQNYPSVLPVLVTATKEEPAAYLAETLRKDFPELVCLNAGEATHCGQKNHNLLHAVRHIQSLDDATTGADTTGANTTLSPEVFVFCDSTHVAPPDFLDELVQPIARGEVGICTGYHDVVARDAGIVSLAYQISVMLMRFLQAIAVFTQPWGGATAISRTLFESHHIARLWETHVVDDCSLAALTLARRVPVRLCPRATLTTTARAQSMDVWRAWMERQVLFLKFCIKPQWYLLGFFAFLLLFPCIGTLCVLVSADSVLMMGLALAHAGVLCGIMLLWRCAARRGDCDNRDIDKNRDKNRDRDSNKSDAPAWAWCGAFFLGIAMFFFVFLKSARQWHIDWHGVRYDVSAGGRVVRLQRK